MSINDIVLDYQIHHILRPDAPTRYPLLLVLLQRRDSRPTWLLFGVDQPLGSKNGEVMDVLFVRLLILIGARGPTFTLPDYFVPDYTMH